MPLPNSRASKQAADHWNTRPHPAPPEGEPDFMDETLKLLIRHGMADAECIQPLCQDIALVIERMYRLGLAARPKAEDAEVIQAAQTMRREARPREGQMRAQLLYWADLLERLAGDLANYRTIYDLCVSDLQVAESKLAEREAELATVRRHLTQSDYSHYMRTLPDSTVVTETNWLDYEKDAVLRHRNRVNRNRGEPEIATAPAKEPKT